MCFHNLFTCDLIMLTSQKVHGKKATSLPNTLALKTLNISTYFFVKEVIQLTLRYNQNVIYNHTTYPPKMVV